MKEPVIRIRGFAKRFGSHVAVDGLDLDVPAGSVFGLIGQNGAGKTTTIRCMLDLLRPSSGSIHVFGLDSVDDSVRIRSRVGYLPEEPEAWDWMTVRECLWFHSGFYPGWDTELERRLRERLGLDPGRRLGQLSRGTRAKVGLVAALAPRPELLILDDPTAGLDPLVRREFLEATIETVNAEGNTVFFSTHLLHEMERIADRVAILHEGRLLTTADLDELKRRHKRIRLAFNGAPASFETVAGLRCVERGERGAVLVADRYEAALLDQLRAGGAHDLEVLDMDLEEIFVETVRHRTADLDGERP